MPLQNGFQSGGGGHDGNSVQYGNMTRPIGYVFLSLVVQKCSKNSRPTSNEVLYRTSADLEWQNISSQHATFLRFLALYFKITCKPMTNSKFGQIVSTAACSECTEWSTSYKRNEAARIAELKMLRAAHLKLKQSR